METLTLLQLNEDELRTLILEVLESYSSSEQVSTKPEADDIGGIEVAMEVTGLSKATIYSRCSLRTLPHRKKGKKLYFSRKELEEWIESGRRKTRTEITSDKETRDRRNYETK